MDFFPFEPIDDNQGQKFVWDKLKNAFGNTEGVAYYRYPIFFNSGRLHREPDMVMLIRRLGAWVIECKGCRISNIREIQGHQWTMTDWFQEVETPLAQAEDRMFAIQNKFNQCREIRNLVSLKFKVALPFITRSEWTDRNLPYSECILFKDDFAPKRLTELFTQQSESDPQKFLTDDQWELCKKCLGGILTKNEPRPVPSETPSESPVRIIQKIESDLAALDEQQQKIAFEIPPGPQRIRGLAGTGKTVLFAKRIAKMHARHPDWRIAYIFFTKSLYGQINELVVRFYREMTTDDPDLNTIRILHSWGGRRQNGFYHDLALKCGHTPKDLDAVKKELNRTAISPAAAFEYVCNQLETSCPNIPELYDAIIIDEGQDLPPVFYRLAYKSLKPPKRLYWAYDEAQGIGTLTVPRPESIFGKNSDGSLVVDLQGFYEGGIRKAHSMKRCYRTPNRLMMTAHAVNMGLYREGGPLQGVTNKSDWESLGYHVDEGDFLAASVKDRKPVKLSRLKENSPHLIDRDDDLLKRAEPLIAVTPPFKTEDLEREWIAKSVADDIQRGFKPDDILITGPTGDFEKDYFLKLRDILGKRHSVKSHIAQGDTFRIPGIVTISNIFRAKGNEAWKVYVCRFQYAVRPLGFRNENEIHKRNEAFVSITRSRLWCVITGLESPIFNEIKKVLADSPYLKFPAFNRRMIQRINDEEEVEKTEMMKHEGLEVG